MVKPQARRFEGLTNKVLSLSLFTLRETHGEEGGKKDDEDGNRWVFKKNNQEKL